MKVVVLPKKREEVTKVGAIEITPTGDGTQLWHRQQQHSNSKNNMLLLLFFYFGCHFERTRVQQRTNVRSHQRKAQSQLTLCNNNNVCMLALRIGVMWCDSDVANDVLCDATQATSAHNTKWGGGVAWCSSQTFGFFVFHTTCALCCKSQATKLKLHRTCCDWIQTFSLTYV